MKTKLTSAERATLGRILKKARAAKAAKRVARRAPRTKKRRKIYGVGL